MQNRYTKLILIAMTVLFSWMLIAQEGQELYEGITYIRDERSALRPMVIHVVLIDLEADGIAFFVTPADDREDYDYTARTATQFIEEFDVQIAINGDFYGPVRDDGNETESGVNAHGLTILDNVTQTTGFAPPEIISTMYIDEDNHVTFNDQPETVSVAISGKYMLVIDNEYTDIEDPTNSYVEDPHPRTAIGLSEDGETLILMVVDGRQPDISEGATLPEMATFLKEYGAYTGINLDGGGSATLAWQDENGTAQLLNIPFSYGEVNAERLIANHLGVFAKPIR